MIMWYDIYESLSLYFKLLAQKSSFLLKESQSIQNKKPFKINNGDGIWNNEPLQFSLVQSLSHVWLFATPWTAAHQASLSITNSWSLPKLKPIESVMPSCHLTLCRPLLLLPPIPPSIMVFSSESAFHMSHLLLASISGFWHTLFWPEIKFYSLQQ